MGSADPSLDASISSARVNSNVITDTIMTEPASSTRADKRGSSAACRQTAAVFQTTF